MMSLQKKTGKKVGDEPGHEGKTLEQVAGPDQIVVHLPGRCTDCQTDLADIAPQSDGFCRRQVLEIPEPKVLVTQQRSALVTSMTLPIEQVAVRYSGFVAIPAYIVGRFKLYTAYPARSANRSVSFAGKSAMMCPRVRCFLNTDRSHRCEFARGLFAPP